MQTSNLKLTERQRLSAEATDKSLAILAGAGSGKTAVIIERIKNIVATGNAGLHEIVAITFTEKAAGELLYRLAKELGQEFKSQLDRATITTIDGFCSKILKEDGVLVGINPEFRLLEEHASQIQTHRLTLAVMKELLRSADPAAELVVSELGFRYAISSIEDLVEYRWHVNRWHVDSVGQETRERNLNAAIISCFRKVLKDIEAEKARRGVVDFIDLEIKTLELLENHNDIKRKYQKRIRHLLIDEYQDTSNLQTEIIKHIYNPKTNVLCIVGDPGQSIYRFRGANPEGIVDTGKLIEETGGMAVTLTENFRSAPPIIDFANELFAMSKHFMPLKCMREAIGTAKVLRLNLETTDLTAEKRREIEAEKIAEFVLKLHSEDGARIGDIAVLFRSFTDIAISERAFKKLKIPFYRSGGRTFLIQPEVVDIILCLKALADPSNDTIVYGLARSEIAALSDEECYRLFAGRKMPIFDILTTDGRFGFLKNLLAIKDHLSIPELIREIVEQSNIHTTYCRVTGSVQPLANIEKLISITDIISSEHDYTLEEFLDYIDDLKARAIGINEPPIFSPRDNAVKLLTIHAAKGLEFKVVILADLGRSDRGYSLPYIIKKDSGIGFKFDDTGKTKTFEEFLGEENKKDSYEKERLLYVAVTRAKEMLLFPIEESYNSKASLGNLLVRHADKMETIYPDSEKGAYGTIARELRVFKPYKKRARSVELTLTASHLDTYHRCPEEYYLKYSLRLPAEDGIASRNGMGAEAIGNIVHRMIFLIGRVGEADWKGLVPAICREFGYETPGPKDLGKIDKYIKNYQKSPFYDTHLSEPEHEIPFAFKLDEAIIKGTIDCIYREDNGYSIVDFKTGRIGNYEKYELQTMIYAIAAKKALRAEVKKMSLLFLDTGSAHEVRLDNQMLEEGMKLIQKITDSIGVGNFEIKGKTPPCVSCPYKRNGLCTLTLT